MRHTFALIVLLNVFSLPLRAQDSSALNVLVQPVDTVLSPDSTIQNGNFKTMRRCAAKKYPPHISMLSFKPVLRNQYAPFGKKFIRASGFVLAIEMLEMVGLFLYRSDFTNWNKSELWKFGKHYKAAYTLPPVMDKDDFLGNFVEHPYQGTLDYNALRSQGAPAWQSALFVTLHSTFWEYVIEACEERPSIQDLIVTPIGGIVFGEIIHYTTMQMSKNGFTWYEAITVTLLNPMFVLNNGFRFASPKRYTGYKVLE